MTSAASRTELRGLLDELHDAAMVRIAAIDETLEELRADRGSDVADDEHERYDRSDDAHGVMMTAQRLHGQRPAFAWPGDRDLPGPPSSLEASRGRGIPVPSANPCRR